MDSRVGQSILTNIIIRAMAFVVDGVAITDYRYVSAQVALAQALSTVGWKNVGHVDDNIGGTPALWKGVLVKPRAAGGAHFDLYIVSQGGLVVAESGLVLGRTGCVLVLQRVGNIANCWHLRYHAIFGRTTRATLPSVSQFAPT